jgi:hypothetical protein
MSGPISVPQRSRAVEQALAAIRKRQDEGTAQIGQQTQGAISDLERHLGKMR